MKREQWTDYTASFKPLYGIPAGENATPMYSYERPAYIFWSAFMNGLQAGGLSERQAKDWLTSKKARWMLDGDMSEMLEKLAFDYAKKEARK